MRLCVFGYLIINLDHSSWTKAGIPSSFSFEGAFDKQSPYIHSDEDVVEHIDFEHMRAFIKTVVV